MAEPLSKREQTIVCILYTILRQDIQNESFKDKLEALHGMLIACDIHISDNQIEELVNLANELMESRKPYGESLIKQHYNRLRERLGMNLDLASL